MASSNDGSNKGPAKAISDPAGKKPSALIDLKPSDVEIRDPKASQNPVTPSASTAAAPTPAGGVKSEPGKIEPAKAEPTKSDAVKPETKTAGAAGATAASGGSGAAAASSATSGTAGAGAGKPAGAGTGGAATGSTGGGKPPAQGSAALPPPASGGLRSAATHLVAGLAGGLIALLGADALLPKIAGVTGAPEQQALKALETRLQAVEVVAARPAPPETAGQLGAFEQKLAAVERLSADVKQEQAKLAEDTKAVGERLAAQSAGSDAAKLARLEEVLDTLAAAAGADKQGGRIPQLAAISSKLTDLEASVATQLAQLRKSVTQEVDSRLSQSSDAAQTARAGTQRLDRELAGVKTEAAQISQKLDQVKDQADRAEVALNGLRGDAAALKSEIGVVRGSVAKELAQVARPTDVASAVTPLTAKLAALEQNVQGVVRGESDRRANVERIVVALELGNLKRTVERGASFSKELAEVKRIAGTKIDLSALERFKDKGVSSIGDLEREFRSLAFRVIEADAQPADAHWSDRLLASAKSIVRVRKTDQAIDDKSAEATVARIEQSLRAGKLGDVAGQARQLADKARAPIAAWLEKVNGRAAVDQAIAAIEQELKQSLGTTSQADKKG